MSDAKPKASNGVASMLASMLDEKLLRGMGLGAVLDEANKLAASGVVGKALRGLAMLEQINERLSAIESQLAAIGFQSSPVEAYSGSADGELVGGFFVNTLGSFEDLGGLNEPRRLSAQSDDDNSSNVGLGREIDEPGNVDLSTVETIGGEQ